jgi:hypothetical protein
MGNPYLNLTLPEVLALKESAAPVVLPAMANKKIRQYNAQIELTEALVAELLDGGDFADVFLQCQERQSWREKFEFVCTSFDESDQQEIERLCFNVRGDNDSVLAEDIWMKASWLSFDEEDASLRFRFSFGMDFYEDVAKDVQRERYAAQLAEHFFPESAIITGNRHLIGNLQTILGQARLEFVERIIYFNAPNGGAKFHHDVERGHLGVCYAQVTGKTVWIALSKQALLNQMLTFIDSPETKMTLQQLDWPDELIELTMAEKNNRLLWADWMDEINHDVIDRLLNHTPSFIEQLVAAGHAYLLEPGDVILLPQDDLQQCAWHTVFCAGDEIGQGLSFAIRAG